MGSLTLQTVESYLLDKPGASKSFPFDSNTAVYKAKNASGQAKMFAIMPVNKTPVNISLKCDPGLAESLREQYESVLPGYHLNKRHWNTLILSGQISEAMLQDLIDHSYRLVTSGS